MTQPTMNGALAHPLVQKIMAYQLAMARGDMAAGRQVFHDDVQYIVPGANLFSGSYRGPDEVMGYFARLMAATDGTYAITAMNWLVCGDKILLETDNSASRGGRQLRWDEAILFEFRDGRKSRIEMFQADQAAVDAFFKA
jgi:uncharacterized protein